MRHINQIGIFWQGEIRAMTKSVQIRALTKDNRGYPYTVCKK